MIEHALLQALGAVRPATLGRGRGAALAAFADEMAAEHGELVDALLRGDGALARQVVTAQLQMSRKRVLEALVGSESAASGIRLVAD